MRRAAALAILLAGCGELTGGFTVEPGAMEQATWASTELTLTEVAPRILLDRGADGVRVRPDARARLGDIPLTLLEVTGERSVLRLSATPPLGSFPVTIENDDGLYVSANDVRVLAALRDGGLGLASEVLGLGIPGRCETNPALTHDARYLLVARARLGFACGGDRDFRIFEWNGGAPTDTGEVIDSSVFFSPTSGHPLDGAVAGMPGTYAVVYTDSAGFGPPSLRLGFLVGSPPMPTVMGAQLLRPGSSPTLTADGRTMVFLDEGRVWELESPLARSDGDPRSVTELIGEDISDPALSPDGLRLVYSARETPGADRDLFVAEREERDEEFENAVRLPRGAGQINSTDDEGDPFIGGNGELLFTTNRDGPQQRVYSAWL